MLFLGLLVLVVQACDVAPDEDAKPQEPNLFNVQQQDADFAKQHKAERWTYLIAVTNTAFIDRAAAERWLVKQVQMLFDRNQSPSQDELYDILYLAYDNDYRTLGAQLANYAMSPKRLPEWYKARGMAATFFVQRYGNLQERDSLQKYLPILETCAQKEPRGLFKLAFYSGKGKLYQLEGNFFEAVVSLTDALRYAKNHSTNLFVLHHNIANLYITMDMIEKAGEHINMAIAIKGFNNIEPEYYNAIATIKRHLGEFEAAESLLQRAIGYSLDNNKPILLAQIYGNYGNLKRKEKQFDAAMTYFRKSDSICMHTGANIGLIINAINSAECLFDQKQFVAANTRLQGSGHIMRQFQLPHISMEYYNLQYRIYDSLGLATNANASYREYMKYREAYFGDLPRSIIAEWQLANQREEFSAKEADLSIALARETKNKYAIGFVLSMLSLALTVLYFIRNRKRLLKEEASKQAEQNLRHQLEMQSRELLAESMNNMNIQHTKDDIVAELEQLIPELPDKQTRERMHAYLAKLTSSRNANFFDEFETRFKGVHEAFFNKILTYAPDLTATELRICAFIRLNITTKDIAKLTGKSAGTIENTRINIRKKLQLEPSANLQLFLMNL